MAVNTFLNIELGGGDEFGRVAEALGFAKSEIPDEVKKVILELAEKLAHEASLRVLAEETHGSKHTGLRAKVSAGVYVEETGDGFKVGTSMPNENEAIIPRGFDTRASRNGWRHPLFGNREKWYRNYGSFSWFLGAFDDSDKDAEMRLKQVLDHVADQVARS